MSKNKNIYIIAAVAIALVALMYLMSGGSKRHNWWEHYSPKKESPYGTSIVFGLMKNYFPEKELKTINDSLVMYLSDEKNTGSYFYIGPSLWLDSARIHAMLAFVNRGNDAFIISPDISFELLDSISHEYCIDLTYERDSMYYDDYKIDQYFQDTLAALNFVHPEFRDTSDYIYNFRVGTEDRNYGWDYLPPDIFCEYQNELISLGTINDTLINFAKTKYGDGNFYLHTTPLVFTNYHIIKSNGREYAEKVLSHLEKSPVLWDATQRSFEFPGRNRGFGKSPLKYVLAQPPLAWAWYILLGMAVLYLIFRAKRRQRVIPILEKNENTSLEFINTIGRLYFIQNNHRQLALEKMKLFLGFVREHYNIPTKEINDAFKKQLSVKSEIPVEVIEKIFTIHGNIERSQFASENTLVAFHREMEGFYLKCK